VVLFAIIEFLVDRLTLSEARVGSEISSKVAYALMSSSPVSGQLQTVRELIGSVNTRVFVGTNPRDKQ
jgi:hypothetical protein